MADGMNVGWKLAGAVAVAGTTGGPDGGYPCRSAPSSAGGAERSHLQQAHRAHPAAQLPDLPSARRRRADVARHLRRSAPMGTRDQAAHRPRSAGRRDAAVVRREEHRHSALQGRPVAERCRDRRRSPSGPTRAPRAATPTTCRRRATSTTAATGASASPTSSSPPKSSLVKAQRTRLVGRDQEHSDPDRAKTATCRRSKCAR